jgi:hypothetical protein
VEREGKGSTDRKQVWSVPEAIEYMKHLVEFKPVFIEGLFLLVPLGFYSITDWRI